MTPFVHLHCHTDFSLLDGASSIKSLVARAKALGMTHLALTDHGNMFGTIPFYNACREQGIVPVIGTEVYKAPGSRLEKSGSEKAARYSHLVLLARNATGYANLIQLSSLGYTEGFYYKPRVDDELLARYHEGLIALSACLAGDIPAAILDGQTEEARKRALFYRDLFGPECFYLELQDHGIAEQAVVNREIVRISRETGIPLVATNDIHYTLREDARAQDVLICIGTGKKLSDGKRLKFEYPEFYCKSGDEMAALFPEQPEALANTVKVAQMCSLTIEPQKPQFPVYEVPDGFTPEEYLRDLSRKGLAQRYDPVSPEAVERLDYELSVVISMGFTGYFLVVWDFINYAKQNGIPVGPGRGSGAGSLVAYCLKITDIDPLKYGLLFERFLNPERVSLPDFDIDFGHLRREEVIQYVTRKYGEEKVGQIITFGTLGARAVIRDVARVLDFPYDEADAVAKLVPDDPKIKLPEALKDNPKLAEAFTRSPQHADLRDICLKLEGLHRHASMHAAGIVIGREPLTNYVPLYRDPKSGQVSTQYTMNYLEECGLIKMDFLGLKTLTLLEDAVTLVRKKGVPLTLADIPEDDPATFRMFSEGKSTGAFQFESSGMQGILKRIKPDTISELIALNALYRPGPMDYIDTFIENKQKRGSIQYPLPELEPVLRETFGVPVYQEQVMQITQVVGGFSLGQADIMRRVISKKKISEMPKVKEKFVIGAKAKGYDQKTSERIFGLIETFAGYGFNKSHSAAYAIPAYQTIWFKANHPAEFLAANCTNDINDTDRLAQLIREAREMGIDVLPPNVNVSLKQFTVEKGKIVFGLMGIKGVGSGAVDVIIQEREARGPFASFVDFFDRITSHDINRKVAEALVITGAFDTLGETRATLMASLDRVMEATARAHEERRYGQASLFEGAADVPALTVELERLPEFPASELLDAERINLGFFFSGHPLDQWQDLMEKTVNADLSQKESLSNDRSVTLVGTLSAVHEIRTKNGRTMAFGNLEDLHGSIELIFFSDVYENKRALIVNDAIVGVLGKIDTTRGDAKVKVEDIMEPKGLPQKPAQAVHVKMKDEVGTEESLHTMREYLLEKRGGCTLFFHVASESAGGEVVVQASSQIRVAGTEEVVAGLREYPQVADVWTE